MELSKEAMHRTLLVKCFSDTIRKNSGLMHKTWHVFTHKRDVDVLDPKRFIVYQTASILGSEPKPIKEIMEVTFNESRKNIGIVLKALVAFDEDMLKKCRSDENYKDWSVTVDRKKGIRSFFRR
jgi:hypothetical protein